MKTNKIDLDLDFIGGQGSLTKDRRKRTQRLFQKPKIVSKDNFQTTSYDSYSP